MSAAPVTLIRAYRDQGAKVVGWTATPRQVSHICDELVRIASVSELIQSGHLAPPVVVSPDMPDMEALSKVNRQSNGEYSVSGARKIWNCKTIIGRVFDHYARLRREGVGALLYAQGVPESLFFAQRFSELGVRAAHVDGDNVWVDGQFHKSDSEMRRRVQQQQMDGSLPLVCNRFVYREGYDSPVVGHIILACVLGTRSAFAQTCGRGLRPFPGKDFCVIQDHGGHSWSFPPLDSDEPWDMDSPERLQSLVWIEKARNRSIPMPIVCFKCFCVRWGGDECTLCGHRSKSFARPVIQANGELKVVTSPVYVPRRVRSTPTDQEDWDRLYWASVKHRPDRTFQQIYSFFAFSNNWRWLPRNLRRQPSNERQWFLPVGEVPIGDLR